MTDSHDERHPALDEVRGAASKMHLPAEARRRIEHRLQTEATGSTTLRDTPARRIPAFGWIAAAAAVIVAIIVAIPFVDRQTTVSAAEILGRSQQALDAPAAGVEVVTYDLQLSGVLEQLLPPEQSGRFTVEETVDHDHAGRYRLLKLSADGRLAGGVADDPLSGTRARYIRLAGQGHLLRFTNTPASALSMISLRPMVLRSLIGAMQANGGTALHDVTRSGEAAYEITAGTASAAFGPVELLKARVVIGKTDARVLDFDASGAVGGQPFAATFHLKSRQTKSAGMVSPADFAIEPQAGDEVVDGVGSSPSALWDVMAQCLRR